MQLMTRPGIHTPTAASGVPTRRFRQPANCLVMLLFLALVAAACNGDVLSNRDVSSHGNISSSLDDSDDDRDQGSLNQTFARREPESIVDLDAESVQKKPRTGLVEGTKDDDIRDGPGSPLSPRQPGSVIDPVGLGISGSCGDIENYLRREAALTVSPWGYGAPREGLMGSVVHRTRFATYWNSRRPNYVNPFWYVYDQVVATSVSTGDRLIIVYGDMVRSLDISGRSPVMEAELQIDIGYPEAVLQDLLVHEDRLLMVFHGGATSIPFDTAEPDIDPFAGSVNREDLRWTTVIAEIGLGEPQARVTRYLRIRGQFVDAAITADGLLRLVTGYEQRRLPGEAHPGDDRLSELESLQHNRELAAAMPLESWMPEFRLTDGDDALIASGILGDCSRSYRLGEFAGPGVLSVTTLDLADSGMRPPNDVVSVITSSASVHTSPGGLFVTTSPFFYELGATDVRSIETNEPHVDIHRFETSEHGVPNYADSIRIAGWAHTGQVVNDTLRVLHSWYEDPDEQHLVNYGLLVFDITDAGLTLRQRAEILAGTRGLTSIAYTSDAVVLVGFPPRGEDAHAHVVDLSDTTRELSVRESVLIRDVWAGFAEIGSDLVLHIGDEAGSAVEVPKRTVLLLDVSNPANPRLAGEASDNLAVNEHSSVHTTDDGAVAVIPLEPCDRDSCTVAVITATADGLTQTGTVTHRDFVITSELVGDTLYTITARDMIATDLTTMEQIARLPWGSE